MQEAIGAAINSLLLDSSASVRQSAIELIARVIIEDINLMEQYYDTILGRIKVRQKH